jgi:HEAT repeat protein
MLRIDIPLGTGNPAKARLVLIKNLSREPIQPFTLRRVEYVRRSAADALNRLFPSPSPALAAPSATNKTPHVKRSLKIKRHIKE